MTNESELETIRRRVGQPMHAIRGEIVILPLFTIGDDRRAGGFKSLNGVADGFIIERIKLWIRSIPTGESLDQT